MSTTIDLNLSFSEIRASRQPLASSTIAYRGSAMGVSSGAVRPLVSGDVFAGFLTGRADNRSFASGANPLRVQLVSQGLVELEVAGVLTTSLGAVVYATDENTFTLTSGGSVIGVVQECATDGTALVSFEAFGVAGSTSSETSDTVLVQVPFSGAGTDVLYWVGPGTLMQVVLTTGAAGSIVVEDQIAASPAGVTVATLTTTTTPETFLINSGAGSAVYAGVCLTITGANSGYLLMRGE